MNEINHENTEFIICPHCGFEHEDVHEYADQEFHECMECEELFYLNENVMINYTTEKS